MKIFIYVVLSILIGIVTFFIGLVGLGQSSDISGLFWLLITIAGMLPFIFIPFAVAHIKQHPYQLAIFWLNLFVGWTAIGWAIVLVWACMYDGRPMQYTRY